MIYNKIGKEDKSKYDKIEWNQKNISDKECMSYLTNGQQTTVKNERNNTHMSVIPFPVCVFVAIVVN